MPSKAAQAVIDWSIPVRAQPSSADDIMALMAFIVTRNVVRRRLLSTAIPPALTHFLGTIEYTDLLGIKVKGFRPLTDEESLEDN